MSGNDGRNRKEKEEPGFGEILAGAAFASLLGVGLYTAGNLLFGATKTPDEKAPEKSLSPEDKLKKASLKRESEFKSASDEPTLSELAKQCFQEVGGILIEEEWMPTPGKSNEGKGDLVFEFNGFHYVVECKHLSQSHGHTQREQRRQGRHKVIEQANRYAEEWPNYRKKYRPDLLNTAPVLAYIVTNEEGLESARM